VAHRFAGFLGIQNRTHGLLSAEKMGRYLPNGVGRMKRISITYMKDISDIFKRGALGTNLEVSL
jgi:hypothetical protein